ncbi:efflux RND transporter periplasmic adaptor subunit [Xanthobacter sp. TB0139]|uniref:efflux RND transporter periplasmic adaptor subunit n=1 Tax=Xanthobacter sp. TB0139 TaxID=3459178 RepID=UPI00403A33DD
MPERSSPAGRIAIVVLGLAILGGAGWLWQHKPWNPTGTANPAATASRQQSPRTVAVLATTAVRKGMPVRVEALGTVEPMVTVPIRARVAGTVARVAFEDGAQVKAGDLLFTLDPRVIDAQIRQAEATLARDRAQLEKTRRDVARYSGLVTRNAISQVQLEDSQTALDVQKAVVAEGEAKLDALKVERSYYDISAPVSGRMGVSSVRMGAVIRVDETLATVRQLSPIYVTFGLPERYLGELRADRQTASVAMTLQGTGERIEGGRVAVIDNMVDTQTGTVPVRAIFENADERLWPGTLGAVTLTLRIDPDVVAVPSEAVRVGQDGAFIFVVEDGAAQMRPVKVARTVDGESVISSGLKGGETVVTDGQLALRNGSAVNVKGMAVPMPAQSALGG